MKKKKILFITPLPPPDYGSALSSQMCLNILQESKNFEVKSIKINYSEKMQDVGKFNINKILGFFRVLGLIKKEITSFKPDLVYLVPATSGLGLIRDSLFVKKIKKLHSGEIILHVRSRITERDKKKHFNTYKKMFEKTKVVVLGESLREDVYPFVKKENLEVFPNAIKNEVSEKEFNHIIQERNKSNSFNLLFLSNMNKEKGWFKVLESCAILKSKNIPFNCFFVGEWATKKDKDLFENFVKKYNLQESIKYLGKKTGKEKNKILRNSNLLVFPTEYKLETFGRVIVEAMMFGIPVIANSIASIPSIIENKKTGFLLKENSPKEIASNIEILQRNKSLRIKMGIEGRKRFLKNYELTGYKTKFLKLFK